jgi:hypothetical protein
MYCNIMHRWATDTLWGTNGAITARRKIRKFVKEIIVLKLINSYQFFSD